MVVKFFNEFSRCFTSVSFITSSSRRDSTVVIFIGREELLFKSGDLAIGVELELIHQNTVDNLLAWQVNIISPGHPEVGELGPVVSVTLSLSSATTT